MLRLVHPVGSSRYSQELTESEMGLSQWRNQYTYHKNDLFLLPYHSTCPEVGGWCAITVRSGGRRVVSADMAEEPHDVYILGFNDTDALLYSRPWNGIT